jgi:hypothetical protein
MGHSHSKGPKFNKNHNKQKMFRIGMSAGRNYLNLEEHVQVGYCSKTIKNYESTEIPQESSVQNAKFIEKPQESSVQNAEE